MNIRRPFAPSFLNKLDNFLLLNKPSAWAARTHLVFYYCLLFMVALGAAYYLLPNDPRSTSTLYVWVGFLSIICITALVVWLIYLLRFNVFKRFGVSKPLTTLVDFILYFIATSVIVSFCLVPTLIETVKANQQYTTNELIEDINNTNIKICLLEYDSLPKKWRPDTLIVRDTLERSIPSPTDYEETIVVTDSATVTSNNNYTIIDTANLALKIKNGDSLTSINDSTYILFICPQYTFLMVYNITPDSQNQLLTSEQIYYKVLKDYRTPDKVKVQQELSLLINKYYYADNERYNYGNNYRSYNDRVDRRYKLVNVADSMEHISERKYRWDIHGGTFLMIWFYFSFTITLLIFAFRHTTTRIFFLSLLSIFILFILTMLMFTFLRSRGFGYYLVFIIYFLAFTVIGATTFGDQKRRNAKGISINLFMFMLPFIPLIITGIYYEWLQHQFSSNLTATLVMDYEAMSFYFVLAQVAGPVLFLLLLPVYVHQLYRKWYGLPAE